MRLHMQQCNKLILRIAGWLKKSVNYRKKESGFLLVRLVLVLIITGNEMKKECVFYRTKNYKNTKLVSSNNYDFNQSQVTLWSECCEWVSNRFKVVFVHFNEIEGCIFKWFAIVCVSIDLLNLRLLSAYYTAINASLLWMCNRK